MHTHSPKFLVEFDSGPASSASEKSGSGTTTRTPVIRRVCVPNSWAGDYHLCARQLGAAADFFAATERPNV
ncbi:MAG: hypothetical protein IAE82_01475 [Opitutaceae bacterium]|nr:hypothetical protein [Opitutaceae bacterium]